MKLAASSFTSVVVAASALGFAACSAAGSSFTASTGSPGGSGGTSTNSNSTGVLTGTGGSAGVGMLTVGSGGSSNSGMGGAGMTYAYAHTNTELYEFVPPAAATDPITMNLVGTFDCIGNGTGSSSSGGPGVPTTCAQANNTVGCCDGNTNYYCSSGAVKSKACSGGEVCTWDSSKSYYGCGSAPAMGENGGSPMACSGGSSTSSSGSFAEDSSMTDIAVDSAGNLWGVSEHYAYKLTIQGGGVVHCSTPPISLQGVPATFYGLSFVPAGVIDTNAETLLASDTAGDLWRIDQTTGALEQHGNFGTVPAADPHGNAYPSDPTVTGTVGMPWQFSGDIVFLADTANGGKPLGFATVRDCNSTGCSGTDTLLQIDPTKLGAAGTTVTANVQLGLRGQIKGQSTMCSDPAGTTYGEMYGIAAWNSTIYGFSHLGYIVAINNADATACKVGGTLTTESWSGAAVTTIAPVMPPPPPM